MATFPALKASSRSYSMGVFPVTEEKGFGGGSIRFKHGNTSYGHVLDLGFLALTQAQAKLIRDHYRAQHGGHIPFALSTEVWAGHSSATSLVPSTMVWRYASPPEEVHDTRGFVDVSLSLISTSDMIFGSATGMTRTVTITLTRGAGGV